MKTVLTIKEIIALQTQYGINKLQEIIDNGLCWKLEGSVGRSAMTALVSGACLLPLTEHYDTYGSKVPSRTELLDGTKGTLGNSQKFWQGVCDGKIELDCEELDCEEYILN